MCLTIYWFPGRLGGDGALPHPVSVLRVDHVRHQSDLSLQLSLLSGDTEPVYPRYVCRDRGRLFSFLPFLF